MLIYVILAVQFDSFMQPVVVMVAIPLGIIGVIIALILVATWLGILDETVVGAGFEAVGDRILAGLAGVAEWAASAWETRQDA